MGLIVAQLFKLGDLRRIGSGNIGATNVLRTGNKSAAALTLLLDGGKGAVAVVIAQRFGPDMAVIAAGAVVVGHIAPVWLLFKGGKGVATTLGVLLAIAWPVGLIACGLWARRRRTLPLFVPRGTDCDMRVAGVRARLRHAADRVARRLPRGHCHAAPCGKHRAPRAGPRAPHRPERPGRARGRSPGGPMNVADTNERRTLSEAERLDWLRLARCENVGPITFFALLDRFGSPAAVLDALPALAHRGGRRRPIKVCSRAAAEREVEALTALGGRMIALVEPAYPPGARRHRRPAPGARPAGPCGPAAGRVRRGGGRAQRVGERDALRGTSGGRSRRGRSHRGLGHGARDRRPRPCRRDRDRHRSGHGRRRGRGLSQGEPVALRTAAGGGRG